MNGLMRRLGAVVMAGVLAAALGSCSRNPATGEETLNFISPAQEREMGRQQHDQIVKAFGGVYEDARVQSYVERVGQRLAMHTEAPETEFTFTVLNSPIVNAMALPGGYVYVTRGLLALADSEAELASVLGHEIGHVVARHGGQRASQNILAGLGVAILGAVTENPEIGRLAAFGAQALLQSYSREQEHESDTLGIRYMARAGYDAGASARFLESLHRYTRLEARIAGRNPDAVDQYNMMATHPRTVERVQRVAATANGGGDVGREAYLRAIDGLLYGDDPAQGLVRGRAFVHPALRLRFEVPEGFRLSNGDEAVVAGDDNGNLIVFDGGRWRGRDIVEYLERAWTPNTRLDNVERITVNGMPAATGTTRLRTKRGLVDARLVAIDFGDERIYRFVFATQPQWTERLGMDLRRTTYSFQRLGRAEAERVRPHRIVIREVRPGDTPARLARGLPFDDGLNEERLRVLNGLAHGEPLEPGRLIKMIAE